MVMNVRWMQVKVVVSGIARVLNATETQFCLRPEISAQEIAAPTSLIRGATMIPASGFCRL
jgi:hypothetical protein